MWIEVGLLDAHLVDVPLDAAASGWHMVEREGISVRYPAQFVLVGFGKLKEREAVGVNSGNLQALPQSALTNLSGTR